MGTTKINIQDHNCDDQQTRLEEQNINIFTIIYNGKLLKGAVRDR